MTPNNPAPDSSACPFPPAAAPWDASTCFLRSSASSLAASAGLGAEGSTSGRIAAFRSAGLTPREAARSYIWDWIDESLPFPREERPWGVAAYEGVISWVMGWQSWYTGMGGKRAR
jgi:hypothetical protein